MHDKKFFQSEQLIFFMKEFVFEKGDQWVRQKIQDVERNGLFIFSPPLTVCYSLQLHLCFAFTCREWSRLVGAPLIYLEQILDQQHPVMLPADTLGS